MNNPFKILPSYVKESPKFSRFLELVCSYLLSGALQVSLFKDAFVGQDKPSFVIQALAKQLKVEIELPFVGGNPDMEAYFKQLLLAYRAKSFNVNFAGQLVDFIAGDPLSDVSSMVVVDFSVAKKNRQPMSVVYSVLSMDDDLTIGIVRDLLIPRVTGVNASLYYLQFGQEVFGYDIDEKKGLRIGPDHVNTVPITGDGKYAVRSATIKSLGTGYAIDDIVTANGIQFQIKDLAVGAFVGVVSPSATYVDDPSAESVAVTGGSGSGMTIDIVGGTNKGYFIRGFDNGSFISITRR